MGFGAHAIRSLFIAKKLGVDFGNTLTIGRQTWCSSKKMLINYARYYNVNLPEIENLVFKDDYSEPVLYALGANHVDSMDFSDYEKASIIHDLNKPVPEALKGKYSFVIDGGTLEHIFNFPVAIKNCMEMVKVNGYFATITNGNNYLGHGFYQYSPELLYRIFSPENGFTVECMFLGTLANDETKETWYTVNDPDKVKSRINICNGKPVSIIMIAKKIAEVNIFSVTPQQSDYRVIWERAESGQPKIDTTSGYIKMYRKYMPSPLKKLVYFFRKPTKRSSNLGEIDPTHINKFNF